MRWFVIFLLIANVILFFWTQQRSGPGPQTAALPPPDIGRLRLMSEAGESATPEASPQGAESAEPPAHADASTANGSVLAEDATPSPPLAEPAHAPSPESAFAEDAGAEAARPPAEDDAGGREETAKTGPVAPTAGHPPARADPPPSVADAVPPQATDEGSARVGAVPSATMSPNPSAGPGSDAAAQPAAERPASPDDRPVATTPPAEEAPRAVCARFGPFEPEAADALVGSLPGRLRLLSDVSEEYERVVGYYVMIPPLPSRAAGRQKLEELAEAGFEDTWLFRTGANENAISLGLFRREAGAKRHAARLAEMGFATEIETATTRDERRWLMLKDVGGGDPAASLGLPEQVTAERSPCP